MNEEIINKIKPKLLEISSLLCVLKYALNNPDRMTEDIAHYGNFVHVIEQKLNKIQDVLHKEKKL